MKAHKKTWMFILLALFAFTITSAQDLIEANALAKIMKQPNTVIVSTIADAEYAKVHINGAISLYHKDLYDANTMLLPDAQVAAILGKKGISEDLTIVLYDNGTSKYSGRMYWILDYMGAENVKVLNGGMKAWKAARKPITKTSSTRKATTFTPSINQGYMADESEVSKATTSPSYVIVDARTPEEFAGTAETALRPGHIPGAVNVNYADLLASSGKMKSVASLQEIFTAAGVSKDKTVILYCETSIRAGVEFLALKSILGYPKVKVYDGAYSQWQAVSSNKIVQ
jgi:thiosulfate/3-mercaptopyruvate sulfurtransferase